ncbi:unnamed protein product [Prunus brigantina]
MLRIRDHKQKLVDLHNLTTSRGLIGTQASLRCPPRCPRRARGGKGQREAPFLNNRGMHAKLPIASLSRNALNGEQCQGQAKACQGHDMPTQGKAKA